MGGGVGGRPVSVISSAGVYFCICVYIGRIYAGNAFGGVGSTFYEKVPVWICARSGVPVVQYGSVSGVSFFCHDSVDFLCGNAVCRRGNVSHSFGGKQGPVGQ